jgi:hypothetical protein
MQPNLFISVLITLVAGFAAGTLAFLLMRLVSKATKRPALRRIFPTLLALVFFVAAFRFSGDLRRFLDRLYFEQGLNKLLVLGLLAAALAVGFRLSFLIFAGNRRPPSP